MLDTFHLRPPQYRRQPWKNGRGETNEIAVDTVEPFRWRLSWACLPESAAFSAFPGYDRSLVILRGGPVSLIHDGNKTRDLQRLRAYSFKGESDTQSQVAAPAEDFNVLVLRNVARAGVYPVWLTRKQDMQFPVAGQEHFVFCVEGEIEILEPNTGETLLLRPMETFRLSRPSHEEALNLRARGRSERAGCLWVVIHVEAASAAR